MTAEIAAQRWRELNLLLQSLVILHGELRAKKPFQPILRSATAIVAGSRGLLYLREEPKGTLQIMASTGFSRPIADRLRSVNSMASSALLLRKPILVDDPPEEPLREELALLGDRSCLTVPILKRGLPWGALQLIRAEPFAEDEAVLLWLFALILEEALPGVAESVRLPENAPPPESQAGLLELTRFESRLDWEIERSSWVGRSCSLLRVEWRPERDSYVPFSPGGPLRFAPVLRVIRRSLRPVDSIAAWGEQDLLIALPDLDSLEAARVTQELRRNLIQSRALGEESEVLRFLRFAHATYPVHGGKREELIQALDLSGERSGGPFPAPLETGRDA